jgi:hypothetical protein
VYRPEAENESSVNQMVAEYARRPKVAIEHQGRDRDYAHRPGPKLVLNSFKFVELSANL